MPSSQRLPSRAHIRRPRGHRLHSPRFHRGRLLDACAKRCDDLIAGMILNAISRRGFSIRVCRRIAGANAGWVITAQHRHTREYWRVSAEAPLDGACAMSDAIGPHA